MNLNFGEIWCGDKIRLDINQSRKSGKFLGVIVSLALNR